MSKVFVALHAIFYTYYSTREVFLRIHLYDVIFSNSQPSLGTRSSNGGRK